MPILLTLTSPVGVVLGQPMPIAETTCSRYQHDVGLLHCRVGVDWLPYLDYECRIEAWRAIPGLATVRLRTYFVENITVVTDEQRRSEVSLDCYDANQILKWRDIEAYSGSEEGSKTDHADDVMKAYVREQLGALSADAYDASYFAVEDDLHQGPSVTVKNAWSNVLQALTEISDLAEGQGERVYFDVIESSGLASYRFRTTTGQLGDDRSEGSANPLRFGLDFGNVRSVTLVRDASEEVNHVISAGSGRQEERLVSESVGAGATRNVWSRKKLVYNDSAYDTQAALDDQAARRLVDGRPTERLEFDLMEAPGYRYGIDFGFGDRIALWHERKAYSGVVKGVVFWVYENGAERLQAVAEVSL